MFQYARICRKCGAEKPLEEYYFQPGGKFGRAATCKPCKVASRLARYRENPKKNYAQSRGWVLVNKYGLSMDQYMELLSRHADGDGNVRCASCNRKLKSSNTCIDHVHGTKIIRGILCSNCNTGIGMLGDTLEGVMNAARYLAGQI